MGILLTVSEFTADDSDAVKDFECGQAPWQRAMSTWIKGKEAIETIAKPGSRVWLYYNPADEVVGFASLVESRWRWKPPDGQYTNICLIPALGIQTRFQGIPLAPGDSDNDRFSNQIMSDIIYKAKALGLPAVALFVHPENLQAIRLYERFGFEMLADSIKGYRSMGLALREPR